MASLLIFGELGVLPTSSPAPYHHVTGQDAQWSIPIRFLFALPLIVYAGYVVGRYQGRTHPTPS